jgi:4-alpha-glucanotransferase
MKTELSKPFDKRSAGILLHITSLPSPYGIGDIGPEAHRFATFLKKSKQTYWQLLPLTPIEKAQSYSPYSANSSMAGNTLLISPDQLQQDGLLSEADLSQGSVRNAGKVNYEEAQRIKEGFLKKAFRSFTRKKQLHQQFDDFCNKEKNWLDDFAVYSTLKQLYKAQPWFEWPDEFKFRKRNELKKIEEKYADTIQFIKWQQYIFSNQWTALKNHCTDLNVLLFGDLPFYVSYDSADVWSHPEYFAIDENMNMTGVAGVPPDYFNADGQLWGMPVFNWKTLKQNKYDWWIKRLRKNIELFDVVRLDHFRAFADYWDVPAVETTAKNGQWKRGPGNDFFNAVKAELGTLPFIAEDLGDINEDVYKLRDKFRFPGMKILQFAFSDNVGQSSYIPHNYTPEFIVYTGTHDNNTTLGWFRKDIGKTEKKNLSTYLGKKINENNVNLELTRLAYSSVANIAIIPFQDILGFDETTRMNTPASVSNNWMWRLKANDLDKSTAQNLAELAEIYNRA